MADHLWFIPVTGGSGALGSISAFPITPTRDLTNVQWNFSVFPVGQEPPAEVSCLSFSSYTAFTMGTEAGITPSQLRECYGSWSWRSCADDSNIICGGQLAVGTVFSRQLRTRFSDTPPPIPYSTWGRVEVWAKYRVDVPARLDNVYLSINDRSGNVSSSNDDQGQLLAGTWRVIYHQETQWGDWDDPAENLRVVLSLQGTTNVANVGVVNVDVEWFAICLSEEGH